MPIILNMTEEEFDSMRKQVAELEDMEERLEALKPLTTYEYHDELLDEAGWQAKLAAAEADRDSYKQKYIDRFFSGTGITDMERERDLDIEEDEREHTDGNLSPQTFDELLTEEE